ncbi:hypothetical protein U472_15720 [Orenia metallireducens]|uniref:Uncharacterized protein n=1 Tax=Orenia metallireducens TaxID=1413210 RepID=A0A1C0A6K8_9FIRM|nr:hypothetical protein [Orenia metallireducens]OCL25767.1 hypothetical protein U472_15720 [Orenia metallireducens]
MSRNKEKEKQCLPKWCIGGDINQSQNCNVDVKQPNSNVICSNDTNTSQIVSEADDEIRVNQGSDSINRERSVSSQGNINQSANSIQKTEQPESNVYNADSSTIRQSNKSRKK